MIDVFLMHPRFIYLGLKMKYIYWIFLMSFFFQSCGKESFEVLELPECCSLEAKVASIPVDLYMPSKMLVCGNKLVIRDNTDEGIFKVFDFPELSYEYSFGNIGPGPQDLSVVDQESFIYDDKFMFVDNFVLKSKDLSDPKSLIKVEFQVALRHGREVFNAFKKQDDSLYVSNANVEDLSSEYRIFNVRSGAEVSYGKMPDWDENLNMPIDKQIAYMKAICVHPSDGRKMMFYCHYPVVRIYSSSGQWERQVCVGTNSPGSIQKDDKTIYFTEPYVTSEYVYVMWIKRTKKDVGMNVESFSPEILVFDWSGNVVNRYKLDKPVVTIAVKDNTLYATSFIDMNQIYIYDLLPASNAELTPYSNDFLSFKMLSEYPMSKASRKNFEELDFEEKDGYKRIYYYFFNREKGKKKKQDLGSLCITYACSSQEDDIQLDSYLDYLKNRPQVKPLSYIELEPFDSNGRSVYPIQKLIARFNPSLNRNDSVYATEYYLKEKNAIISLDVFSDCKDVPLQKYSKEIRRIIDSMCIK